MTETFPFIQTKLYRQHPQADFVPRMQLLEQFEGWRQRVLTLVFAWPVSERVRCSAPGLDRKIVRDLVAQRALVAADNGDGWRVHDAFFSSSSFTDAAVQEAMQHEAVLIDLNLLGQVLDG